MCMCRPAAEMDHCFLNCEVTRESQTIGVGPWIGSYQLADVASSYIHISLRSFKLRKICI